MQNIDLIFLFVIAAFIGYYFCKRNSLDSFEGFAAIDDARQAVREVYNADIDAIRNLSTVATKLQAGGLNVPGVLKTNKINLTNDKWENNHEGNGKSYVVNDDGNYKKLMLVGNDSGGGGVRRVGMWDDVEISRNLQVNGGVNVNGNINGPSISTNNPTWNGWISGNFGMNGKDRVVIGNLDNQAAIGAHNNALNAWTPLRLQGDSINMVPNNGIVNYPNGWRINTADGHFRIQKDGADKFVVHNGGYPVYTPNGINSGEWNGEGGGAISASKVVIKQPGTDNKFALAAETPGDGHQYSGQRLALINKNGATNVRFYQGGWGNMVDEGTESIDFFKRQDGPASNPNSGDKRAYLRLMDGMWAAGGGGCGTGWPHAGCNIRGGQFG